jgi:hypothetical protein
MDGASNFWFEVNQSRKEVYVAAQKQQQQPRGLVELVPGRQYRGSVYIISLKNREKQTLAGDVVEATIELAGQRISEGTHVLASDQQILDYKKAAADRGEDLKRRERLFAAKTAKQVIVEAVEAK